MTDKIITSDCSFAMMLQSLGNVPSEKLEVFLAMCERRQLIKDQILLREGDPSDVIFFVESGATRHHTMDKAGNEHTTHFAFENEFEADYRAFLTRTKSAYTLQALKDTSVIAIPREAYDWIVTNVEGGQKIILTVSEIFLIYFATRLRDNYVLTPLERYEAMEQKFPGIYDQVPQYMIASYIGVTKVHLSRLKSQSLKNKSKKI